MKRIDWSKVKSGDRFTAIIDRVKCEGKIHKARYGWIYLCQNYWNGEVSPNKHGYKYSWGIKKGTPEDLSHEYVNVTNLKIYSKPMKKAAAKTKKAVTRKTVVKTFKATNKSKWEIVKATTGTKVEYFFRVVSLNRNILATGRGYNRMQSAIKGMNAVRKSCFFPDAGIYYPSSL